jgi:hypothetical protein
MMSVSQSYRQWLMAFSKEITIKDMDYET